MTPTVLALALLLASPPHSNVHAHRKGARARPAKKAAAPAVTVDPSEAKAAAMKLGLSKDLVVRVENYAQSARNVAKGGLDGGLCTLVDEAVSLGQDLHTALDDRNQDPAKVAALESAAPGLRLGLDPEGGAGGARYAALSRLAAAKHPSSARALAGAGGMLDQKRPGFIHMMKNDERGCTDYSRAQSAIEQLAAGWNRAPACLKERLKGPLTTALADDELPTCWCQSQEEAAFSTKHYAAKLSTLKDFDGAGHAKAILAEVDDASAHFSCNAE